ncbi:MAG: serine/threonine-protein kinase, partial [Myxococcota bacterium]
MVAEDERTQEELLTSSYINTAAHGVGQRPPLQPGRMLAECYRLGTRLGMGGMGEVYLAENVRTGGRVAIKLIQANIGAAWPKAVQRFALEARHTASLNHPNIVQVYDYGRDGETLFHVMEYIQGISLHDIILQDGALPWTRVVHITRQILMALGEAHESERRLIHQDVKPSNVLVTHRFGQPDFVKVVDFGIARALAGPFIPSQRLLGSPQTMAPEQWNNLQVSPATDLYALGCTVYTMLAGSPPFQGSLRTLANKHLTYEPTPLSVQDVELPAPLESWVFWLMHKPPRQRPQSAREALRVLEEIAKGESVVVPSGSKGVPLESPPKTTKRFQGRFVGRHQELEALDTLVENHRWIVLHGPGGVGALGSLVVLGVLRAL